MKSLTERIIEAINKNPKQTFTSGELAKTLHGNIGTVSGIVSRLYQGKLLAEHHRSEPHGQARGVVHWKPAKQFTYAAGRRAITQYETAANRRRREKKRIARVPGWRVQLEPAAELVRPKAAKRMLASHTGTAPVVIHQFYKDQEILMMLKRILPDLVAITKALGG